MGKTTTERNGDTWEQQEKLVPIDQAGRDSFGNAISITGQGSLIAVGSRADDPLDETGEFRAQFENIDPASNPARDLWLDIYYDRGVAETILAKNNHAEADRTRLNTPAGTGYVIDDEMPLYTEAAQAARDAITGHMRLLGDDLGVAVDPPLGYQVFQERVPLRGLALAQGTNAAGSVVAVAPVSMLYEGYKDLVLLFDLLRDYGRNVITVAQLKGGTKRGGRSRRGAAV